jgi:hypothetical protein
MMTIKQIAQSNDLTVNQVRARVYRMDLKAVNKDKRDSLFSNSDIEKILNYKGRRAINGNYPSKVSDKKKIMIIEYYMKHPKLSIDALSGILLTDKFAINSIIREWMHNDKFLTIQSKL